jgi:hypothetical protein
MKRQPTFLFNLPKVSQYIQGPAVILLRLANAAPKRKRASSRDTDSESTLLCQIPFIKIVNTSRYYGAYLLLLLSRSAFATLLIVALLL